MKCCKGVIRRDFACEDTGRVFDPSGKKQKNAFDRIGTACSLESPGAVLPFRESPHF